MKKEGSELYRNILRIPASLLLAVALGISQDAAAEQPFCTPDDLCVEVKGKVTGYVPNAPEGVGTGQCQEPCHITHSGKPVIFGITAACPEGVPFGTEVMILTSENESKAQGNVYTCQDTGDLGRIGDPEAIVDIAVNYNNDDPNLYTSDATLVFKYREGKAELPLEKSGVFNRKYQHQPEKWSVQVPSLSR